MIKKTVTDIYNAYPDIRRAMLVKDIGGYTYAKEGAEIYVTNRLWHGMECAYLWHVSLGHFIEIRVLPSEYELL